MTRGARFENQNLYKDFNLGSFTDAPQIPSSIQQQRQIPNQREQTGRERNARVSITAEGNELHKVEIDHTGKFDQWQNPATHPVAPEVGRARGVVGDGWERWNPVNILIGYIPVKLLMGRDMDELTETGVAHIFVVLALIAIIIIVLALFLWSYWMNRRGYRGNIRKLVNDYWTSEQSTSSKITKNGKRGGRRSVKKKAY